MTEEARAFVGDLVWNDRNFMELFTADYGYPDSDLAAIYGVKAPAKEFDRTPFPAGSERAGYPRTGAVPGRHGQARGFVPDRARAFCARAVSLPARARSAGRSEHESSAGHRGEAADESRSHVRARHQSELRHVPQADRSDRIRSGDDSTRVGAKRDKFRLQFSAGRGGGEGGGRRAPMKNVDLDIDAAGYVAGIPDSQFSSPSQLGAVLAKSAQCQECMVKQYFRYNAGRVETPADRPVIRQLVEDFRKSQFRFKELIVSMVRLREFPTSGGAVHVASDHKPR